MRADGVFYLLWLDSDITLGYCRTAVLQKLLHEHDIVPVLMIY